MTIQQRAFQYGQRRAAGRLGRAIPWIGTAIALATLASAVRRKGILRGAADTALNATPFVGGLKTLTEMVRGRDLFADRRVVR